MSPVVSKSVCPGAIVPDPTDATVRVVPDMDPTTTAPGELVDPIVISMICAHVPSDEMPPYGRLARALEPATMALSAVSTSRKLAITACWMSAKALDGITDELTRLTLTTNGKRDLPRRI